jgi:hypothetical protein
VVVVEAVTKAKQGAGEESEFEARRHCLLVGYGVVRAGARCVGVVSIFMGQFLAIEWRLDI